MQGGHGDVAELVMACKRKAQNELMVKFRITARGQTAVLEISLLGLEKLVDLE